MADIKKIINLRVRYSETDKMGVVYHGNYLDWFEVGRTELCRETGKSYKQWESEGILMPVVEAHCRYKSSLFYDDEVEIETSITKLTKVSIIFSCRVFHKHDKRLAAEGYTKHAFTSPDGKLLREGNALEKKLHELLLQE